MKDVGSWTIDRMVPERDLDEVVALEAQSFVNPWTRDMFIWELKNSDVSYVFVLRTPDGRLGAFCSCWLIFDELHINNVAVQPDLRNQGMGTALLTYVLKEAARLGARRATLEVRESNVGARRLYERLGFRTAGVRRNYYRGPVENALILWREGLKAEDNDASIEGRR